jgi:hypothetical protein
MKWIIHLECGISDFRGCYGEFMGVVGDYLGISVIDWCNLAAIVGMDQSGLL